MGVGQSKQYSSKQEEMDAKLADKFAIKTRRDGTVIKTKSQITKEYDESYLPWPIAPVVKLDYCWRINVQMFNHSLALAAPCTALHFFWTNPSAKKLSFSAFPKLLLALNYIAAVLMINTANISYSVLVEDYW